MNISQYIADLIVNLPTESLVAISVAIFAAIIDSSTKLIAKMKEKFVKPKTIESDSIREMELSMVKDAFQDLSNIFSVTTNDLRKRQNELKKENDELDREIDNYRNKYYLHIENISKEMQEICAKCLTRTSLIDEIVELKTKLKLLEKDVDTCTRCLDLTEEVKELKTKLKSFGEDV